jgi:hypothetical protein
MDTVETTTHDEFSQTYYPMPIAVHHTISNHAKHIAAIECSIKKYETIISSLLNHTREGTVPKSLAFKFKKLYNHETEQAIRTVMLEHAIQNELSFYRAKITDLNSLLTDNHVTLRARVLELTESAKITANFNDILDHYHLCYIDFKTQFTAKQLKDQLIKQKKLDKFAELQESKQLPVNLKQADVSKLLNTIQTMKKKIDTLSNTKSKNQFQNISGKVKGGKQRPTSPPSSKQTKSKDPKQKPTNSKNYNGKEQSSAPARRFRGKNIRQ